MIFAALAIKLTAVRTARGHRACICDRASWPVGGHGRKHGARLLAASTVVLAAAFGTDFIVQVFLFRAVHAAFPSLAVKLTELRQTMDVSLSLGVGRVDPDRVDRRDASFCRRAAAAHLRRHRARSVSIPRTGRIPASNSCRGSRSPEAISSRRRCGRFGQRAPTRARPRHGRKSPRVSRRPPPPGLRRADSQLELGSRRRQSVRLRVSGIDASSKQFARDVRAHSAPDARVATPPMIAFMAERVELIPYPEIAGEIGELTAVVRRAGYLAAWRDASRRGLSFWDSVEASRDLRRGRESTRRSPPIGLRWSSTTHRTI